MLDIPNILLSITALCNAGLVLFIYTKNRASPINIYFGLFALFLSFWALVLLQFRLIDDLELALYLMKASYVCALLIGVSFYFFSFSFPENKMPSTLHQSLVTVVSLVFIGLLLLNKTFLTREVVQHSWGKEVLLNIPEFLFFATIFVYLFCGGLLRIWHKYFASQGILRYQSFAVGASVTLAGITGMYFNLWLPSPYLQNFKYIWSGPLFTFLIALTITYSIFRFKLFNTKVIVTELVTFALWVFFFVQLLLSDSMQALMINIVLFGVITAIGLLLIKSVQAEVEAREKVERLAKDLEKANARLKELDRQKTEFVSIASHQLRSPLTAIKGYASLLLEGSYGKVSAAGTDAIKKIFDSSRYMAASIEDFLSVSRIELGTAKYDMKPLDAASMAKEVTEELIPAAKDKQLELAFKDRCDGKCSIVGDIGKLRQVVLNLIDNSIKYTPKGGITVTTELDSVKRVVRITITDTGVGIPTEVMPTLFKKFSRAKNANEVNVMGTGLGLFVAKQFVEAHKGKLWAESLGQGKGSSFIIELPLAG